MAAYSFSGAYGHANGGAAAALLPPAPRTLLPDERGEYYGAAKAPQLPASREGMNVKGIVLTILVPWLIFTFLVMIQSFGIHYRSPSATHIICGILLVGVLGLVMGALVDAVRRMSDGNFRPTWYGFLAMSSLIAWCAGMWCGQYNFYTNMQPFYDTSNLNMYKSVDPAIADGQQFMDGGRFAFVQEAHLDLGHSIGFRDRDTYCVAPVVSGNATMDAYDFWAVGINCCSAHDADYHCGSSHDPATHSGLRVMDEGRRDFFRLAVQQAEAAYNLRVNHPIFLYWLKDPAAEMNAYEDDGFKFAVTCSFFYLAFQMLSTSFVAALYFKMLGPLAP